MTSVDSPWLHRLAGVADGPRLYCFPFAGGSAPAYQPWAPLMPGGTGLTAIQLPGRQERHNEPAATVVSEVAPRLAVEIARDARGRPFTFFGHSMGALLAYETARELARLGEERPWALGVSARRAPQLPEPDPYHALPEDQLIRRLEELGGIPAELLAEREFIRFILPMLRADFALVETYRHAPGTTLSCPVWIFGGENDPRTPPSQLSRWAEVTEGPVTTRLFPGGHFYLWEHGHALLDTMLRGVRHAN